MRPVGPRLSFRLIFGVHGRSDETRGPVGHGVGAIHERRRMPLNLAPDPAITIGQRALLVASVV